MSSIDQAMFDLRDNSSPGDSARDKDHEMAKEGSKEMSK